MSPDISKCIHEAEAALGSNQQDETLLKAYTEVPEAPIDTAISEKSDNLFVLPGNFEWQDLGSWEVVYDLGKKDENGNVIVRSSECETEMPIIAYDSKNNYIYGNNQPVGVVGLSDIVIVDTGYGILVCNRMRSNDVKKIVEEMKLKHMDKFV